MTKIKTCPKCTGPVPAPPTGRPPTYCSPECRRLAEYEIRRLLRQLDEVAQQISYCHLRFNLRTLAELPKYQAEEARLEARLRELLAGDDPPTPDPE